MEYWPKNTKNVNIDKQMRRDYHYCNVRVLYVHFLMTFLLRNSVIIHNVADQLLGLLVSIARINLASNIL